ncbi:Cytokinin dehydrogenase 3, partial [Mucuna pruriens]
MERNIVYFSKVMGVLWLWSIMVVKEVEAWSAFHAPKELAAKFSRNPEALSLASTDYGHIVHKIPWVVFEPSSLNDISDLISFSNSLPIPFTIAPRGQGHSVLGQAMTRDGVVLNMTHLNAFRNGSGILVSPCDGKKNPLGCYADVGGEQRWIDVLNATLKRGLTPLAWTDYLYLSIGGTLSNAGINGRSFRFGPQIFNVLQLDIITGKGDLVTCSPEKNSEAFYAVLGGLGQFGVITRARIPLGPAPTRASIIFPFFIQIFLLGIKVQLICCTIKKKPIYMSWPICEAMLGKGLLCPEVANLIKGLNFVPTFMFEKNASYVEFLDRVHAAELVANSQGLWEVPHPWLNIFVPRSRISDFNEGVFKGIILKQNITTGFCKDAGIKITEYLTGNKTHQEWVEHFGSKWKLFEDRKAEFDPKRILSPGQGIFQ